MRNAVRKFLLGVTCQGKRHRQVKWNMREYRKTFVYSRVAKKSKMTINLQLCEGLKMEIVQWSISYETK